MSLKIKGLGVAAAAFAGLMATSAYAIQPPNLVTNGSFEDATNFKVGSHNGDDTLLQGSKAMPGWTVVGAGEVGWFSPDVNKPDPNYDITAFDGSYSIDLTGNTDGSQGQFGGLQQSVGTVAGQSYHLSFELGSDAQYGLPVSLHVTAGAAFSDFSSSAVNDADHNANAWTLEGFDFTATSSHTVITLQGTAGRSYIGLDDVRLTGPAPSGTPEPAAWALMLVGFGGMGSLLRRHRGQRLSAGV